MSAALVMHVPSFLHFHEGRPWLAGATATAESDAPPVTDGHGNERSHPLLVPVPQGRSFAGDRPGVRENLLFLTTISSFFSSLFSSP